MKNATQVMLERARIQNQNACIAEDCINEESDRFNNSRRRSSVGATATANLAFLTLATTPPVLLHAATERTAPNSHLISQRIP